MMGNWFTIEGISNWITIDFVSQFLTIIASVFAIVGFWERKTRKELERRAQSIVWSDIAKLRGLMTDLEKPLSAAGEDYGKHQAVGKLTSMYRDKVKEVYEVTPKVSPNDVKLWRATGKIASDWQEACFWETFPSDLLTSSEDNIQIMLSKVDELPETHHMAAKPKLR